MEQVMFDSNGKAVCGDKAKSYLTAQEHIQEILKEFPFLVVSGAKDNNAPGLLVIANDKKVPDKDKLAMTLTLITSALSSLIRECGLDKDEVMELVSEVIEI